MGADKRDLPGRVDMLLASTSELTVFELREEWWRHHRMEPPKRISRVLLLRGIAYKLQQRMLGGHSKATLRKLAAIATDHQRGTAASGRPTITLKPGTRLVREWHGVTHRVLVSANDFAWEGQRFASLSDIARAITGAHWSGHCQQAACGKSGRCSGTSFSRGALYSLLTNRLYRGEIVHRGKVYARQHRAIVDAPL